MAAAKGEPPSLKDAIHTIQLALLDGVDNENHLFAAGSLLSRSDYEDAVTERSISNACGYPLCRASIPSASSRPRKGRYRISLKEHKVYDLQETYRYCSTPCVVKSRTFAESLNPERCEVSDARKIGEVLRLFVKEDLSGNELALPGNKGIAGVTDLKIMENLDVKMGQMCIGPSNAIEGYVPVVDRSVKPPATAKKDKKESKRKSVRPKKDKGKLVNELDFTSTIFMGDQLSMTDPSLDSKLKGYINKLEESEGDQFINLEASYGSEFKDSNTANILSVDSQFGIPKMVYDSAENVSSRAGEEPKEEVLVNKTAQSNEVRVHSSDFTSTILMGDQFSMPNPSLDSKLKGCISELEESEGDQFINLEASYGSEFKDSNTANILSVDSQFGIPKMVYDSAENASDGAGEEPKEEVVVNKNAQSNEVRVHKTDFTSTILTGDQFSMPDPSLDSKLKGYISKLEESEGDQFINLEASYGSEFKDSNAASILSVDSQFGIPKMVYDSAENASNRDGEELKEEVLVNKKAQSNEGKLKSSLKVSGAKKLTRSVTWADERKTCTPSNVKLCEVEEVGDATETVATSSSSNEEDADGSVRRASAEACAAALSQAAEAVASGEADVTDAVSEAGLVILPQPHDGDQSHQKNDEMIEADLVPLKWPKKPGVLNSGVFDTEDSWYDPPPEGFSLNLSSFATMYMALFGWITSSSLAYIYGQDDDTREEFVVVNGREYPHKIVLSDGRSSEIKLTLAGCLSRVLPKVATDLRLKTPISTIEKEVGNLLNTMSFVDSLPPFKLKQWHAIALLFMDALSVCRIPGLAPHKTSWLILLKKVLDSARVTGEEYETMKDLLIPLGRVPQFSSRCGA